MIIFFKKLHKSTEDEYLEGMERNTAYTLNLNKDISQLLVERDSLIAKLNEETFRYQVNSSDNKKNTFSFKERNFPYTKSVIDQN